MFSFVSHKKSLIFVYLQFHILFQGSLVYRSGSPGDTSHSGPQSPVSPASSPGIGPSTSPFSDSNSYFISQAQANALQQHFEQFSMVSY